MTEEQINIASRWEVDGRMKHNSNLTPKQQRKRYLVAIGMALYVMAFQFLMGNMDWIIKHVEPVALWFVLPVVAGLFFYFWCDWSME